MMQSVLAENQLYLRTTPSTRLIRILTIHDSRLRVIDMENPKSFPKDMDRRTFEFGLQNGIWEPVARDPWIIPLSDDELPEPWRTRRDELLPGIRYAVEAGITEADAAGRAQIIAEVMALFPGVRSENSWYAACRNWWQGGQVPNALIPKYRFSGAPGKRRPRPSSTPETEQPPKRRGKKHRYDSNITQALTNESKLFIRVGAERARKKGLSVKAGWRDTLDRFFMVNVPQPDGTVKRQLAPDAPTEWQYRYWATVEEPLAPRSIPWGHTPLPGSRPRGVRKSSIATAMSPGSIWQVDSTKGDLYLVNPRDRSRCIGNFTLYLVTDAATTGWVGYALYVGNPCWEGVALALQNAMSDKVAYCAQFGISIAPEEWPMHGKPELIWTDRGSELTGYNSNAFPGLGIGMANMPPYSPQMKALIEQDFNMLNRDVLHRQPGGGHWPRERGEADPRKSAIYTPFEANLLIIEYIRFVNNHKPMPSYPLDADMIAHKVQPYRNQVWLWSIQARGSQLRMVTDEDMRVHLLRRATASITDEGVAFKGALYTAPALERTIGEARRGVRQIQVRYDPRNADYIYPFNKREEIICQLVNRQLHMEDDELLTFDELDDIAAMRKEQETARKVEDTEAHIAFNHRIEDIRKEAATEQRAQGHRGKTRIDDMTGQRRQVRNDTVIAPETSRSPRLPEYIPDTVDFAQWGASRPPEEDEDHA